MFESSLQQCQRDFAAAIRSGERQAPALGLLSGDAAHNEALLAVYRGNAVANAGKALSLAYPVIEQVVGEAFFAALCRAYWDASPSRSGDLNEYGSAFAAFLADFPHVADLPYLPDLARVEWRVACAARAADHVPVVLAELAAVAPQAVGDVRFSLQAALDVMHSPWPIASIWQQHQADFDGEIDIDLANTECISVHRQGFRVAVTSLSAGEGALWTSAMTGASLAQMLEAAFAADGAFDVQAALQAAFAREFVTALSVAPG